MNDLPVIPGFPVHQGKVRYVYDLGERLLLVASDRISAFDWILPTRIPDKGKILTQMSLFWFRWLGVGNHLISSDLADFPQPFQREEFAGRSMLVQKTTVFPVECVIRGYLAGSGWVDYQKTGAVCGVQLPAGLPESAMLEPAIFTPATKAAMGSHDENISFATMQNLIGEHDATILRDRSLDIYERARAYARTKGLILADTKFEWGRTANNEIILIDEVLTPDSSRFWPMDDYQPGRSQVSFDKQFVRDWLLRTTWDRNSPPPELPADIVAQSREKYLEALERLSGQRLV
ncbi:MAG: phosphoribosylaminoimidazolesuccinocarboxamide synthase [Zavarzinella sp.]